MIWKTPWGLLLIERIQDDLLCVSALRWDIQGVGAHLSESGNSYPDLANILVWGAVFHRREAEARSNTIETLAVRTVLTDNRSLDIPYDRAGSFEPLIIGKQEQHFTGFDDILPMSTNATL